MTARQVGNGSDVDEKLAALMTNASAIRAIASAVEGTIGPKGLDTMLVDRFGEVIITNAGVTILDQMDVNHPAARMLINIAKAQQEEIGDGTTTATIVAGALVSDGVEQVVRGVPVARVIEGVHLGIKSALASIKAHSRPVIGLDEEVLKHVALIAGREHEDIADLVVGAARMVGEEKLRDHGFKLADTIIAEEGADNEVFMGVIVDKERLNQQMPKHLEKAKVLVIDDALEPEEIGEEALGTETGFAKYLEYQQEFRANIAKIIDLGVTLIVVDRGVHDYAEEMLTDAGVMVISRVSSKELRKVADHTGARVIKRSSLKKDAPEVAKVLGAAELVYEDERLEHIRIMGGEGKPMATILVGAATEEVVGERERIAKDAASSVQAAVRGGVVPGGGATELAVARDVEKAREGVKGMSAYGVDCVSRAMKKPLSQIVLNAGFNPLEKVEEVYAAQLQHNRDSLAVNCDTGEIADMLALGVLDPTLVKLHAVKAAGEVAEAILRIDTIIKKRDENSGKGPETPTPMEF
ncbi:MAG: TCP-1/cpn60 chaperonin family protein [Bacillota bacterium]